MVRVQRVQFESGKESWTAIGNDYLPIRPIQEFIEYLENIERSPNTIKTYTYHLKAYWKFLEGTQKDWMQIGLVDLAEFVAWLRSPQPRTASIQPQESKRTESTVNAIITAVGMFYDFHERSGIVKNVPLYTSQVQPGRRYKSFLHHINKRKPVRTKLLKLKEPKRKPKTLEKEKIEQLLQACNRIRDKFLIVLLYESGIRIGQALGLRHGDISSWDNQIRVVPRDDNANGARAKTKETYSIDITRELMELYSNYLLEEFGETDSDYVFVNLWEGKIGHPMSYNTVAALFERMEKKTGIKAHPHMFRHTHATDLIRDNWDAAKVQKRLGHANVQTVLNTYTHLNDEDMKKAYQDFLEKRNDD